MIYNEIDVVIPCAGNAEYFEEALDSVINQNLKPKSIYVVDNACSHDEYLRICNKKKSALIHYIKLPKRIAAVENWQYCLSLGFSEYFAFIHDDDVWRSNYLNDALNVISEDKTIVLTAHHFFNTNLSTNSLSLEVEKEKGKTFDILKKIPNTIASFILSTSNAGHMSALVFKRTNIGFSINSKWMPDQTFLASYLMTSEIALVGSVNSFIRLSPNNGTAKVNTMGFISVETIIHLRNVIEVYVRNRALSADNLMPHISFLNTGYVKRLKQACFSWPLNPILLKFGFQLLVAERAFFNRIKYPAFLVVLISILYIVKSLGADFIYFSKDFFSKKTIQ